jgi:hypothetical protein
VTDLSAKTALTIDSGLFGSVAERLARDFGQSLYYAPWKSAFPRMRDAAVGEGLSGVERVYDLFDVLDRVDLIVFPDVGWADLQQFLRLRGHRVWGAGAAEWLELDRPACRELQRQIGVGAPDSETVRGLGALRARLAALPPGEDRWVKISLFRGETETFHHEKLFTSEPWLDDLAARLGPLAGRAEFLVESSVEGVEIAYDCFTVDGKFPPMALWGVEVKDAGYLGVVQPYDKLPEPVRSVNAAFAPTLAKDRCRSAVSFEMRVPEGGGAPAVIDPAIRCGSPCTEAWLELWENVGQIFWEGAAGKVVAPVPAAKYVAEVMVRSEWALSHWTPLDIPPEVARWVKLKNKTVVDGKPYFVPLNQDMPQIGAVVGLGDTLEEAIAKANEVAEAIDGFQVDALTGSVDKALEAVGKLRALGIDFGGG